MEQIAVCFLVVDGCFFHRIEDYACFSCRCCVCALVDEMRVSINGRNDPKRLRLLAFDAWVKNNETREKTKKSAEDESLIMVSVNMNTFDNDNAGLWSLTSTSFCLFVIISFPPWHKQELHSTIPSLSTRIPMGKDNRAQSRHPLGHNSRNISSTKLLPIIPKNHSRNARPLHWSFAIPTSKRHAPLDLR